MDVLTFVAAIVKALAWPVAAIVIAVLFRKQLRALLERIRKGKIGPAEFEFEQEVKELVEQTPAPLQLPTPTAAPTVSLATNNPRAAILEAWLRVESSAHRLSYYSGSTPPSTSRNTTNILRSLGKTGLLSSDDIALFNDLRGLRNQAVHDVDFRPSPDSAIQYVQLADGLQDRLNRAANDR
jgi:hypothetical protein